MQLVQDVLTNIKTNYPDQNEFYQAVSDVFESVEPYIADTPEVGQYNVLRRMVEPDRIIQFKVTWQNDQGGIEVNRGWRVQFNNALGSYKGGLRFHPSVSTDTFKFLGFEQIYKNALTGLPMGGGKGGSDFDPKGRSDTDILSFCQAFMMELHKYIGPHIDVPAGDIGVGGREIGYLFATYKKITGLSGGVLTGKTPVIGGSYTRKEATGYGAIYFLEYALNHASDELAGKTCAVSGSGNVSLYAVKKLIEKGAKVISVSDSQGTLYFENGITEEDFAKLVILKEIERRRLHEFDLSDGIEYLEKQKPWELKCDIAVPCATQNEIGYEDANTLHANGCQWICEGANMPTDAKATDYFKENGVIILPAKAANAGGVAVSGLERTQNAQFLSWSAEDVDQKLQEIMQNIHTQCINNIMDGSKTNYIQGANIAGFKKVAEGMINLGTL